MSFYKGKAGATAIAHPNIALIKYWGKSSDLLFNEPAVSSLSITLDTLATKTSVYFDDSLEQDEFVLNGERNVDKLPRISQNLDRLRALAQVNVPCRIETSNNFPTAAGLASSASGFAALVEAVSHALQLKLDVKQKSMLARAMSGSAARSIGGGFVKIVLADAESQQAHFGSVYAEAFAEPEHWPLEVCVGITSETEKSIGSTEGMELSRRTSPYYQTWIEGNDCDVAEAETAVLGKDFEKLAELSEFSCLKMHALAMASRPGLLYWAGPTVDAMHAIRTLRTSGTPVFFTIDAGPQIKAISAPGYGAEVAKTLAEVPGVKRVIRCGLGHGSRVVDG